MNNAEYFDYLLEGEKSLQRRLRAGRVGKEDRLDVFINGEIDEAVATAVVEVLHGHPRAETVRVYINSNGGLMSACVRMCAALIAHGGHKIGYARECNSAALAAFLCCDERIGGRRSSFLYHSVGYDTEEGRDIDEGSIADDRVNDVIMDRAGIKSRALRHHLRRTGDFGAAIDLSQAFALGIVTKRRAVVRSSAPSIWRETVNAIRAEYDKHPPITDIRRAVFEEIEERIERIKKQAEKPAMREPPRPKPDREQMMWLNRQLQSQLLVIGRQGRA